MGEKVHPVQTFRAVLERSFKSWTRWGDMGEVEPLRKRAIEGRRRFVRAAVEYL